MAGSSRTPCLFYRCKGAPSLILGAALPGSPASSAPRSLPQHMPVFSLGKRGEDTDFRVREQVLLDQGYDIHRTRRGGQVRPRLHTASVQPCRVPWPSRRQKARRPPMLADDVPRTGPDGPVPHRGPSRPWPRRSALRGGSRGHHDRWEGRHTMCSAPMLAPL